MNNSYKFKKKAYTKSPAIIYILIIFYCIYCIIGLLDFKSQTANSSTISLVIIASTLFISSFQILFFVNQNALSHFRYWIKYNCRKIKGNTKKSIRLRINKACYISITLFFIAIFSSLYINRWLLAIFCSIQIIIGVMSAIYFFYNFYKVKIYKMYKNGFLMLCITVSTAIIYYISELSSSSLLNQLFHVYPETLPHIHSVIFGCLFVLFMIYSSCLLFIFLTPSSKKSSMNKMKILIIFSSFITGISTIIVFFASFKYILYFMLSISYHSDTLPTFVCNGEERKLGEPKYKNAGYKEINSNIYLVIYKISEEFIFDAQRLECNNDEIKIKELLP